mmetsp:Transcript_27272/g.55689  ORF Transcript_27272/g.55689 Transcript_27272/m.55689 type:complete len:97 (+) Transcript_27272:253-543(+)
MVYLVGKRERFTKSTLRSNKHLPRKSSFASKDRPKGKIKVCSITIQKNCPNENDCHNRTLVFATPAPAQHFGTSINIVVFHCYDGNRSGVNQENEC